ncbi:winged helix-turn-helix domain-containing protein [Rhizobium sp. BK376]|uniref:winged helix-turn-helix domain-containing protein n=1 Tax=Rhizobium sp. BK376 TaxID=2512149 RepID=UPI00104D1885|nr:winged helix-turn-helix domain-containing protein [Rhizobium sp. BK376]TCR83644.1 TolB-like protein [Rhizobium sp. BK376]
MSIFEFAGHQPDLREGRLLKKGRDISLRPKSFSLLIYLLENAGRVLSKDELAAAVWPNVMVTDDSLTQCIKDIRRTLGKDGDGLIRTVPCRGYAIDKARIARVEPADKTVDRRTDRQSIAVLPFTSVEGTDCHPWLSYGVAEDIITALAKSPTLFVISRNVSFAKSRQSSDFVSLGRELGARYVLCGSFQLRSKQLRLTAQLVEAHTGGVVWVERFERELGRIFEIQDEITNSIVERLKAEFLPEAKSEIGSSRPDDLEAYICCLRARELSHEWTTPLVIKARRLFVRASELDPAYARALSGIAVCDAFLHEWHSVTLHKARTVEAASGALKLNPAIPEAYAARGFAMFREGLEGQARRDLQMALSIDPDCYEANFFYAFMCRSIGDYEEAIRHYEFAAWLRLTDYVSPNALTGLFPPGDPRIRKWAHLCVDRAERAVDLHPEDSGPLCRGAVGLMYIGQREKARRWIGRALAIDPEDLIVIYNAASVHALMGEVETAVELLERYMIGSDWKAARGTILHDREFDAIRDHPRYLALLHVGNQGTAITAGQRMRDLA